MPPPHTFPTGHFSLNQTLMAVLTQPELAWPWIQPKAGSGDWTLWEVFRFHMGLFQSSLSCYPLQREHSLER